MSKTATPVAFLIAVRQSDETDHIYAILAQTESEAIQIAAIQEPTGPKPRHVGSLGYSTVKHIKLTLGEARII